MKLNIITTEAHFMDHIIPIWRKLPEVHKGIWYVAQGMQEAANRLGVNVVELEPGQLIEELCLVAAIQDYRKTSGPVIYMEHGVGNTYKNDHPGYAGGPGKDRVVLFLNQHNPTNVLNTTAYPKAQHVVVGTPKMDDHPLMQMDPKHTKPIVCLSFHWDCHVAPETRSAFRYYEHIIPLLAYHNNNYELVFHGHPRDKEIWIAFCDKHNIRRIEQFNDVLKEADMYVCDNSSTLYEFAATSKPVVVLNAPWYRRNTHLGIRFWTYIPGPQVNYPEHLNGVITSMLSDPLNWKEQRRRITEVLYPYRGESAQRAADTLVTFLEQHGIK